ncbi:hypothetical protein QF034_007715 [Streptomyces africanus]|uniref:Uncharacterized protein n=1 Tax=Streptomyces africanus TaxID=231024 RepID=A0ABU0R1E4_9ACTN|nr:hypothetical protein [Streptomyces africanus]MDQ0753484.1 hypothetical protein [Streptomyces africanus]
MNMHGSRRGHRAKSRTRRILFGGGALAVAAAATVADAGSGTAMSRTS